MEEMEKYHEENPLEPVNRSDMNKHRDLLTTLEAQIQTHREIMRKVSKAIINYDRHRREWTREHMGPDMIFGRTIHTNYLENAIAGMIGTLAHDARILIRVSDEEHRHSQNVQETVNALRLLRNENSQGESPSLEIPEANTHQETENHRNNEMQAPQNRNSDAGENKIQKIMTAVLLLGAGHICPPLGIAHCFKIAKIGHSLAMTNKELHALRGNTSRTCITGITECQKQAEELQEKVNREGKVPSTRRMDPSHGVAEPQNQKEQKKESPKASHWDREHISTESENRETQEDNSTSGDNEGKTQPKHEQNGNTRQRHKREQVIRWATAERIKAVQAREPSKEDPVRKLELNDTMTESQHAPQQKRGFWWCQETFCQPRKRVNHRGEICRFCMDVHKREAMQQPGKAAQSEEATQTHKRRRKGSSHNETNQIRFIRIRQPLRLREEQSKGNESTGRKYDKEVEAISSANNRSPEKD